MANPFTVQPLGGLQNVANIQRGMQGIAQNFQADEAEEKRQALMGQASEIMERGNPQEIAQFSMMNPEVGEAMMGGVKFANEATRNNMRDSMQRIIAGEDPQRVIAERAQMVQEQGGDPSDTLRELERVQLDPEGYRQQVENVFAMSYPKEYSAFRSATGQDSTSVPAGTREFEALVEASKSDDPVVRQAARIDLGLEPRAGTLSADQRTALDEFLKDKVVEFEGDKSAAREGGKLETQLDLQPKVAAAVDKAKAGVAAAANIAKEERGNAKTFQMYDTAMTDLADALGGTTTGPGMGWIPAMTSNAQIAEGAQAIMAPILKSMFRTAGEGTFTDKDQEMLMNMIPTRSDLANARQAKLQAIDAVVRAKLGVDPDDDSDGDKDSKPVSEMTDEELMNQAFGGGQ